MMKLELSAYRKMAANAKTEQRLRLKQRKNANVSVKWSMVFANRRLVTAPKIRITTAFVSVAKLVDGL